MARKQVRAWIRVMNDDTKQTFRKEVDAWCVKINNVELLVHESQGFHSGLKLWNLTEKYTGMKVGSKRSSMDSAIRVGRDDIKNLEKKLKKPFTELVKAKQECWGSVMELPEEKTLKNLRKETP